MITLKENPKRNSPASLIENFPSEKHRGMEIKPREQRGGTLCELNVCDLCHFRKGRIKADF